MYRFEIPFKVYITLLLVMLIAQCAKAQVPQNDGKVKSELIIKLVNQLDWPVDKEEIKIGMIGKNINFSKNLERQKTLSKHSIVFESDLKQCDIIYVPHEGMLQYGSFHNFNNSLVITAAKSEASLFFDYENGSLVLKASELAKMSNNRLTSDFQLIAP
ncbi:MAG: hypothetical protein ABJH05_11175 [Fulvivirga sp.]